MAQGKNWDESKSPAQNYTGNLISSSSSHSNSSNSYQSQPDSYQNTGYQNTGYQNASYQNMNSPEFKDQKEAFFNRIQNENAGRREYVKEL